MSSIVLNEMCRRNGPSEVTITGVIKSWSVIDDLPKVKIPVLLINGKYDEATDMCVRPYFDKLQRVKWIQMPESSHQAFFEEREKYMEVVEDFLRED